MSELVCVLRSWKGSKLTVKLRYPKSLPKIENRNEAPNKDGKDAKASVSQDGCNDKGTKMPVLQCFIAAFGSLHNHLQRSSR